MHAISPIPREIQTDDRRRIGRRILAFTEVTSTNDVAFQLAADPDAHGTVILADHQTAGRGQPGRRWHSASGASVLMSVIVNTPIRRPVLLCAWAGVSVCRSLAEFIHPAPRLKWPNDVLVAGKKICGILVECKQFAVVGIGLNVSQSNEDLIAAGLPDATSLACWTAQPTPLHLVDRLLHHLDRLHDDLCGGRTDELAEQWRHGLGWMNCVVRLKFAQGDEIGILRRLDWDTLEIDTANGRRAFQPEQVLGITGTNTPA